MFVYRTILGIYLTWHFLQLLPDCVEVFSNAGMIHSQINLPAFGKLPVFLFYYDHPAIVYGFVVSLILASGILTLGYYPRLCSAWLFYGWLCLFNRNPFISNPSLAYIGWILLSFVCMPANCKRVPNILFYGMWFIAALSYTASGIHKLSSPSWIDGTALHHVLTSLLARENILVHIMLALPAVVLKILTWISLFAEISFLFLGTFKCLRKGYWFFFLFFHLGILMTVDFGDLTLGMIVSHLYLWGDGTPPIVFEASNMDNEKISSDNEENQTIAYLLVIGIVVVGILIVDGSALSRLNQLTLSSLWGFAVTVVGLGVLMILERIFPDQPLPQRDGWWRWVIGINLFQLFAVILATFTWEKWFRQISYFTSNTGFHLRDHVSPFMGGLLAYLLNQWLFYWWHYLRHQIYVLWILFHQFHHSPKRIEAITSFYKHPLEIIVDSQIMAALLYCVLGLSEESSIWLSLFSAFGEYIYHMNIKTPKVMGYFFQRPESHRCHHRMDKRIKCPNYSDFPIWDMLNGTFENPERMNEPTGFSGDGESKRWNMMFFRDVIREFQQQKNIGRSCLYYALVIWGAMASAAFLVHSPHATNMSVLVSSPLPIVFSSYRGVETFSTTFEFHLNHHQNFTFTHSKLFGSYNRKNTYGAMFAYGPLFQDPKLIALRDEILYYAICHPGRVKLEFDIDSSVETLEIVVRSKTRGNDGQWLLKLRC